MKKQGATPGQKVSYEKPIDVSNVMLVDPKTEKPTRIGYRIENGKKVRFAKKSGTTL
jgi:large subunit ribosomal protein L24